MKILAFCLTFLVCTVASKPLTAVEVTHCHGYICPQGTVACIKNSSSMPDKRHLETRIECRDVKDVVLLKKTVMERNFTPGTLQSYSHLGNFIF